MSDAIPNETEAARQARESEFRRGYESACATDATRATGTTSEGLALIRALALDTFRKQGTSGDPRLLDVAIRTYNPWCSVGK
jgi:hypothetical protein